MLKKLWPLSLLVSGCAFGKKPIVIVPPVGTAASSTGNFNIHVECKNKSCEEARFILKKITPEEQLKGALLEREQKLRALEEQLKEPSPPAKPKAK